MKKTIIVEILLLFASCMLIAFACWEFIALHNYLVFFDETSGITQQLMTRGILALLASLATLAAIIIIAIKDFPVFKPLVDKFNAKRAAYKEQREAVKAEQAEAAKQARIEQLQAELDELKKDE